MPVVIIANVENHEVRTYTSLRDVCGRGNPCTQSPGWPGDAPLYSRGRLVTPKP